MSAAFDEEQNDEASESTATASAPPPKWMDQNPQLDANGNLKPEYRPKPKWSPGEE